MQKYDLAGAGHSEDERVGHLAVMQVQEVGRAVVGLKHSQVLRAEMRIRLLAGQDRKQKREVGIVRIQQVQPAKIQRVVSRHGGEVGIELVVASRRRDCRRHW